MFLTMENGSITRPLFFKTTTYQMSFFRATLIIAITAVLVSLLPHYFRKTLPVRVNGFVAPGFERVNETFYQSFVDGSERLGASFSAYHRGKLVVDIWGGYADESVKRPWTKDTISIFWSATKAVTSLALAWLVDQGHVHYDQPIIEFWPEFGKHGKENVTVEWLCNHKAGLITTDEPVTWESLRDWRIMSANIENTVPAWEPGTQAGYHALIIGSLVDQVVRRVDPKRRSLAQMVHDEFVLPHNLNFSIGLEKVNFWKMARLSSTNVMETIQGLMTNADARHLTYHLLISRTTLMKRIFDSMHQVLDPELTNCGNNPDWLEIDLGAANGVGNTRSAAKLFSLVAEGKILSQKTLKLISEPTWFDHDMVIMRPIPRGYGFMHSKSPEGEWQLGHPGFGGQNIILNTGERLSFAYLTNAMKLGLGSNTGTLMKLKMALYESLK